MHIAGDFLTHGAPAATSLHILVRLLIDTRPARRRLRPCFLLFRAHALLKHGLGLVDLELGLEVLGVARKGAAVGPAARVGEVEVLVFCFVANIAPDMAS